MKILAISGSLRVASINVALLRAAKRLADPDMDIEIYAELGALPLFNPDDDPQTLVVVSRLRQQIMAADALLIASPEYAHGITGSLKNALDWMVGNESFVGKPLALWNASPRAIHAQASLLEIVTVMSAQVIEPASIAVPIRGSGMGEEEIVRHPYIAVTIRDALRVLQRAAQHPAEPV
jgi:NAD(P)H-dependent FMN reductase